VYIPKIIRPGFDISITVTILQSNNPVTVKAHLSSQNRPDLLWTQDIIDSGKLAYTIIHCVSMSFSQICYLLTNDKTLVRGYCKCAGVCLLIEENKQKALGGDCSVVGYPPLNWKVGCSIHVYSTNRRNPPWESVHFNHLGKKQTSGFGLPPTAVTNMNLKKGFVQKKLIDDFFLDLQNRLRSKHLYGMKNTAWIYSLYIVSTIFSILTILFDKWMWTGTIASSL